MFDVMSIVCVIMIILESCGAPPEAWAEDDI